MKMKIGVLLAMLLAAGVLTGCLDRDDDGAYDQVRPVEPGLYIYTAAQSQNEAALQAADVALRLAVLQAEAARQGTPDNWDHVEVEGSGNVKTLLFGARTRIAQEGDDYVVTYAGGSGVPMYDAYARVGSVRVGTGGRALEDTDAQTPWTVELASPTFRLSADRTYTLTSTGGTQVYRQDQAYVVRFDDGASYLVQDVPGSWSGHFVLEPEDAGDLSFTALKDKSFTVSGKGEGQSFWLLGGDRPTRMRYRVTNGIYRPALAGYRQITGGVEECRLTGTGDYDVVAYPAPEVRVVWETQDKTIHYTVTYNGVSVEF